MKSNKTILLLLGLFAFSFPIFGQAGILDSTFNADGAAFFYLNGGTAVASAVVVLPNEKILVSGTVVNGPGADSDFLLLRYNPDGSLDASFGNNGFAIFSWGSQNDTAKAMIVQPDGKILVAGWTVSNGKSFGILCRFTKDGELDHSFSEDGVIYTGDELATYPSTDLFLTQDGKILWCLVTDKHKSNISRYLPSGELDTNYGEGGQAFLKFGSEISEQGIWVLLPDERMVAIVSHIFHTDWGNLNQFVSYVLRHSEDGKTRELYGSSDVEGEYLNDAIAWNGGIAIAGKVISKLNYEGKRQADFGLSGQLKVVPGISNSIVSQLDEKLIVAGHDDDSTHKSIVLARLGLDGELDKKFGNNGKVLLSFSQSDNIAFASAIDSDDRILVAGQSGDSLFIARFWGSKQTSPPDPGVDSLFFCFRPNPVGEVLTADYGLPTDGIISIELLDLYGRLVQPFYTNATRQAGHYVEPLHFDISLPNGSYFIRFRSSDYSRLQKMVLMR